MLGAQDGFERVLESARAVARDELAPEAAATDAEARWPESQMRALQASRLTGLVVPESAGGLGHGLLALLRVTEILGKACGSTAMCFGMHSVATAVIASKATRDQHDRFLVPIAAGEHLSTLALSEPGTGSHFYLPESQLMAEPDGELKLDGTKSFVTNAGHANSYVVSAVEPMGVHGLGRFSCLIVPAAQPGLTLGPPWDGLGMRGNSSRSLKLDGVRLSRSQLLGEEGDQIWYVFQVVAPYFLIAMAGTYLGIASAALETVTDHLRKRVYAHTGAPLSHSSVLQHRLGVLWAKLERTRCLAYHAAREGDGNAAGALAAICSAKAEVAEAGVEVANDALTLAGGIGFGRTSPLARHLRDLRAAHVMSPTTDLLRTWVGRELLGLPILAD